MEDVQRLSLCEGVRPSGLKNPTSYQEEHIVLSHMKV